MLHKEVQLNMLQFQKTFFLPKVNTFPVSSCYVMFDKGKLVKKKKTMVKTEKILFEHAILCVDNFVKIVKET